MPIDFGTLVQAGSECSFEGYLHHMSPVAANDFLEHRPHYASCTEDWFAAVCILFHRLSMDYTPLSAIGNDLTIANVTQQQEFWRSVPLAWKEILELSQSMNVNSLLCAVSRLMTGGPHDERVANITQYCLRMEQAKHVSLVPDPTVLAPAQDDVKR